MSDKLYQLPRIVVCSNDNMFAASPKLLTLTTSAPLFSIPSCSPLFHIKQIQINSTSFSSILREFFPFFVND